MEMFQGQGIGSWMLREAEMLAQRRGCLYATIAAAKDNTAARRLYERQGYRILRDDPGYWQYIDHRGYLREVNEPCWILEKKLKPG
jgi:ribosomal protein S18 acetylase RimI-like enzyme